MGPSDVCFLCCEQDLPQVGENLTQFPGTLSGPSNPKAICITDSFSSGAGALLILSALSPAGTLLSLCAWRRQVAETR
jgi:hypothetical protein